MSITAKKDETKEMSYALQFNENGNTNRLPNKRAVHPDFTSTYKTRKYPRISRILPTNRHLFIAVIQKQSLVQEQ